MATVGMITAFNSAFSTNSSDSRCSSMLKGQFTLPIQIDLAATLLLSLTGGLAALKRGYDVIGLFALAFVTGVGGGLIRDGLFIQQGPPAVTADSQRHAAAIEQICRRPRRDDILVPHHGLETDESRLPNR